MALQRVLFDNQVRETAVRSSSMIQQATSWDGMLTFNNIQVIRCPRCVFVLHIGLMVGGHVLQGYENKVVELQVVGYKLRALQYYRYELPFYHALV